jgi:hypothetical protein
MFILNLNVYLEFKYNDNGIIRTTNSNSFNAYSNTKKESSYNIKTPSLVDDKNYTVSVKLASGYSSDTYQIRNSKTSNVTTKIRPKLELISGGGNSKHNVGYAKDEPFNHIVTYKLTNADTGEPLVKNSVNIVGKDYIRHVPARRVWDPKARQYVMEPAHIETTPYFANTDNNGIITVVYNDFGSYNLNLIYDGDDDSIPAISLNPRLNIIKTAGKDKQLITHTANSGAAGSPNKWISPNGFDFTKDNAWQLAYVAYVRVTFWDIDHNYISKTIFTRKVGQGLKYVDVPSNAATMDFFVGVDGLFHEQTGINGIEAGPGALNFDGLIGAGNRNCHVKTDTWDSTYFKLVNGFPGGLDC